MKVLEKNAAEYRFDLPEMENEMSCVGHQHKRGIVELSLDDLQTLEKIICLEQIENNHWKLACECCHLQSKVLSVEEKRG